ncbi:MAG: hypothetical protein U1E20_04600 [Methylocystis sp.]|uniref:hypothetical protein n=1 Tax=Methylocystis sp. TaxID=1911079 RepID=UPI003960FF90
MPSPNVGFENHQEYLRERSEHKELAGRFTAVHKIRTTSRPLEKIIGAKEFGTLQDRWAKTGARHRWSVAFPIVDSFRIIERPKAKGLLGEEAYSRLIRQSSTLLPLEESDRQAIANLEIERIPATNALIAVEDI